MAASKSSRRSTRRTCGRCSPATIDVWTYISTDGPFANAGEFAAFLAKRAAADDPYAYAIVDLPSAPSAM